MDFKERSWYPWVIFAIVTTGTFMVNVDMSVLNVALPTLQAAFQTSLETLSWVLVGYLMIITGVLPIIGKLSDVYGRKPFFIAGVLIFGGFSALAAIAQSLSALIVYRLAMGIGSALIQANVMSIVADSFPPGRRGRPLGMIGSVVAIGTIVGPAIGGLLLHYFGWPSIFWLNVPFSVAAALGAFFLLERRVPERKGDRPIDVVGAVYFMISVAALMQWMNGLNRYAFLDSPSLAAFGLFAVFFALYIVRSVRVAEPLIHLALFRIRTFAVGNTTGLVSYILIAVPQIVLPFYLHIVHELTSDRVGLVIAAQAAAMILASPISGWMTDRLGTRTPSLIGLALAAFALLWLAAIGQDTPVSIATAGLAFFGVGMAFFQAPNNVAVLESVPKEQTGLTGGIIATVRNLGRVLGVALASLLFERAGGGLSAATAIRGVRVTMLTAFGLALFALLLTYWGGRQGEATAAVRASLRGR